MSLLATYTKINREALLNSAATKLIMLGLLCLMICVPVLNKCFWVAIILLLLQGNWRQEYSSIIKEKYIIAGLLLVLLFTIGVIYSQASWNFNLRIWDKYLKIFYLLLFLPVFITKKNRQYAILCFLTSVMISEIFAYLHYFDVINLGFPASKHWLFVQDIDSGFVVSFATFLLANYALDNKKLQWLAISCFLICSIDLLILNQERTGYLIYFGLIGVFCLQRFHKKGLLVALVFLPLVFGALFISSDKFKDRVTQVASNVIAYKNGDENTSIGLRLAFANYSFKVIKHHLLLGTGTGSFEEIYRTLGGPKINDQTWPAHPHNEYISILFQLGIPGLLAYLYWVYTQYIASFSLPKQEKRLIQGLIVSFSLLGFCNASLLVNPAGACYMVMLAVFLAAKYDKREY